MRLLRQNGEFEPVRPSRTVRFGGAGRSCSNDVEASRLSYELTDNPCGTAEWVSVPARRGRRGCEEAEPEAEPSEAVQDAVYGATPKSRVMTCPSVVLLTS